jgi:simple sugar transport system permease protein
VIPNPYVGVLAALLVGAVFGAIFAFATVMLQASQVLCGLALTIAGAGIAGSVGRSYAGQHAGAVFQGLKVPLLSDIPILGQALFSQNVLIYLAFIILPVGFYLLLSDPRTCARSAKTRRRPTRSEFRCDGFVSSTSQ